ncbi:hypothetical protein BH23GEM2_BH23GEM2_01910 [soil metagenome]
MPTLRELVSTLRQRPGIDAAVVAGRDGLVVAGDASPHVDLDETAARIPPLIAAVRDLTSGDSTAVIEHDGGHLVYLSLSREDAVLVVLAAEGADLGPLVADLRRYRQQIAALV